MAAVRYEQTTREEIRKEVARIARESFGLSAEEFMMRVRSGRLRRDDPSVARLALLARVASL